MTDNKVMAWLKYKELNIRTANSKYTYGVTLGTSDLPYINRLKHILGVRIRTYDTGYKDGLIKAWEIAKKIFTPQKAYEEAYSREELDIIFGEGISTVEIAKMTAYEIMDKVELYEKQKAKKDKIKDGDEVSLDDGTKGVVVFSSTDGHLNIVNAYGDMRSYNATEVIKTGRHFPQMVEVMKEMRNNDEN